LKKNDSKPSAKILPKILTEDASKTENLAKHFEKVFSNPASKPAKPTIFNYHQTKKWNNDITLEEVDANIKKLKTKSTPGTDKISNKTIKLLPACALTHLLNIYNASLKLSYIPETWKLAKIIVIPKNKADPVKNCHHT